MENKIIKKKRLWKFLLIIGAALMCSLILIYTMFFHRFAIPYNQSRISIELIDDGKTMEIIYEGARKADSLLWDIDDTLYIGYYGTLWTRFINAGEKHHIRITPDNIFINGKQIIEDKYIIENAVLPMNRVYFMPHRAIPRMDDETFKRESADAVLIWDR
jgi:hypothetical protein